MDDESCIKSWRSWPVENQISTTNDCARRYCALSAFFFKFWTQVHPIVRFVTRFCHYLALHHHRNLPISNVKRNAQGRMRNVWTEKKTSAQLSLLLVSKFWRRLTCTCRGHYMFGSLEGESIMSIGHKNIWCYIHDDKVHVLPYILVVLEWSQCQMLF